MFDNDCSSEERELWHGKWKYGKRIRCFDVVLPHHIHSLRREQDECRQSKPHITTPQLRIFVGFAKATTTIYVTYLGTVTVYNYGEKKSRGLHHSINSILDQTIL